MKLSIFPRIWVKATRAREDEEIERRRGGRGGRGFDVEANLDGMGTVKEGEKFRLGKK